MDNELLYKIVAISIGLLVAAYLIPMALNAIANATLTNVDPAIVMVFQIVVPLLAIIGIALFFLRKD